MAELKINGKVKLIMDLQTFDSGFQKREFVVTTQETYPQDVKLEFTQQKTENLDNLKTGDEIDVFFNIRGNEYNGKFYVNLQAWKIELKNNQESKKENKDSLGDEGDLVF